VKEIPPGKWQHWKLKQSHSKKYGIWLNNLTTEEIRSKLLLTKNHEVYTDRHLAALKSNTDALQKIRNLAKDILITEEKH
jgi:hypothetical protein